MNSIGHFAASRFFIGNFVILLSIFKNILLNKKTPIIVEGAIKNKLKKLHSETGSTTAGSTCIRVLKSKSPVVQSILPVNQHPV